MHTHTWIFQPNEPEMSEHYLCECGKRMFMFESERRLNAVEALESSLAQAQADLAQYKQAAEDFTLWGDFTTLRADVEVLLGLRNALDLIAVGEIRKTVAGKLMQYSHADMAGLRRIASEALAALPEHLRGA